MGKSFWEIFCGDDTKAEFLAILNPYSCTNHAFVACLDVLIIVISIYILLCKSSSWARESRWSLLLRISSTTFNGVLGLVYLSFGISLFVEKLIQKKSLFPLHNWLVLQLQGFTWLMLTSTLTFARYEFSKSIAEKLCFVLVFLFSAFLCLPSLWFTIFDKEVSVKTVLDILCFPGSILLISSAIYEQNSSLYEPLQAEDEYEYENMTPFARAGMISKLTFWWLNPLMKKGRVKPLEDDDIPKLRQEDRAHTCYLEFMELLLPKTKDSMLSTLFLWQRKTMVVAGFFALTKILATSTCPIFLRYFIKVAEGEETFRYEGYVLTVGLFLVKCLESLSERQWCFRMRLVGTRVRSMLSAAIYKKQLTVVSTSAKFTSGEIVTLVSVDAYRVGEFHYWIHQIWTTPLQLCLAMLIAYYCVGLAALAAVLVIILTALSNSPVAKLQAKCQRELMEKQDRLLEFISVSLSTMKVVKLYAWDMHFKKIAQGLRDDENKWLNAIQMQKAYYSVLFWLAPVLVPVVSFWTCYFLGTTLTTSNVFTFLATIRLLQEPVRALPDVVGSFIDARVALHRIRRFLEAPELKSTKSATRKDTEKREGAEVHSVSVKAKGIAWDDSCPGDGLRNIDIVVSAGEKVAICGEVGAGKTTLLAAILGELPYVDGEVEVNGKIAYVSQTAWIQTGTIQENILFGSSMDSARYEDTLAKCCLIKDLEMLPLGDLTVIGERGVNLSGGQKQRVQLARALYQNADIYLLDDPFSAVDAHTATHLFNEYVMKALAEKTLLLVTHQVDFLPAFHTILLMAEGEVLRAGSFHELLASSAEFNTLVQGHKFGSEKDLKDNSSNSKGSAIEIQKASTTEQLALGDQLIKKEEKETGDSGFRPYLQYLQSSSTSQEMLVAVYALIGCSLFVFLLLRALFTVLLARTTSRSIFSTLITSLFRAPMSFYDSTPLGRIFSFGVLVILAWEVVLLIVPMIYLTISSSQLNLRSLSRN